MENFHILKGHSSPETAYKVDDYPYGFTLRTTIYYWIESKPGKGDRFGTYTINPKNGRPNKPKYSTYSPFMYLFLNGKGHVEHGILDPNSREPFAPPFKIILEQLGEENFNNTQKATLRQGYYNQLAISAPWEKVKYTPETQDEHREWVRATLHYIKTCEFKYLVNHPERPAFTNPDGEVKWVVTPL